MVLRLCKLAQVSFRVGVVLDGIMLLIDRFDSPVVMSDTVCMHPE